MRFGHASGDLVFVTDDPGRNPPAVRFTGGGPKATTPDMAGEFGPSLGRPQIAALKTRLSRMGEVIAKAQGELDLLLQFHDFKDGVVTKKRKRKKRAPAGASPFCGIDLSKEEGYTGDGIELGTPIEAEIRLT